MNPNGLLMFWESLEVNELTLVAYEQCSKSRWLRKRVPTDSVMMFVNKTVRSEVWMAVSIRNECAVV